MNWGWESLIWHLFAGTRGGENRIRIVRLLEQRPYNAHQIARKFGLDYKTVQHHLKVLEGNEIIMNASKKYGGMYFLTPLFKENKKVFEEILAKLGKK